MDNRHKTLKGSGVVKLGFERIGQDMTEIVNRPHGGLARTFLPQRYSLAQVSTPVLDHRHRSTGGGENADFRRSNQHLFQGDLELIKPTPRQVLSKVVSFRFT